jgi:hypothetical protein
MRARVALVLGIVCAALGPALAAAADAQAAKALFFDKKYADARKAWEAVRDVAPGAEADGAAYWVARCSESLGEDERALREYDAYLGRHAKDAALAEEARTSRVGIASRQYRAGHREHAAIVDQALADPSLTVRYYAALQASALGGDLARHSVPVLRRILEVEHDPDLLDRARLALLRADPQALPATAPHAAGAAARFLHVRVTDSGGKESATLNLPMALADLAFKSLPDSARADLRRKGYDADTFWEQLKKLGPTEILTVTGEDGERIQIWLE